MAEMFNYKINYFRNAGQMAIFWIWNNTPCALLAFFSFTFVSCSSVKNE
jgi:hypothetical protein